MGRSVPILRKNLKVEQLLAGSWMIAPDRYISDGELKYLVNQIMTLACQGLINEVDNGGRVTRRTVINTLSQAAFFLKSVKDHITKKMSNEELTPTVLDRLADA